MAFFGNDAVNRGVNLHYVIRWLAQGSGGTLVFAFLLHAGVSIPMTFVWLAGVLAGRFALRPLIVPMGVRWGLKPLVIAGVLLEAVQFPTYAAVLRTRRSGRCCSTERSARWPARSTGLPTTPISPPSATPGIAGIRSASAKQSPR